MKLRYIIYFIIVLICFVLEIFLISCNSELAFIPVLVMLGVYGFFHFLEDIENIYTDKQYKSKK